MQKQKLQDHDFSTLQTFKRLWPTIKPFKAGLIVSGVALVFNAFADSGLIYLLKPLLDDGFGKADHSFLKIMAFVVVGMIILRGITNFISNYCLAWVSGKVVMTMRRRLFKHLMFMPVSFFDRNSTGKLLSRITYDSEMIASSSSGSLITIVREGAYIISLLAVMFYTSWELTLVLFVIGPIIAMLITIVSKIFRKLSKNLQDSMGELTATTEQMLKGHKVVISFGGQFVEEERFNKVSNNMRRKGMKMVTADSISDPVVQIIASFALVAVLFLATTPLIAEDNLSAGSFTVVFSSMLAMMRPLKSLTNVNSQFQRGMAACQTLFAILDLEPEKDSGTYKAEPAKGALEFKNVSFAYQGKEELALNNISFSVPAGKTVALVGRSGSGKSTIANLVTRFYDIEQGEILLDGVNIQDYRLSNLRENCAVVSQQVHLFNDTIANNIAYAAQDKYSREEIIAAAKAAYALEFIEKLPQGFDTVIGENGASLSGGQRQRLAIARALLRNSPVLILDEATSALDTESERAIQSALDELKKDRTVIVIAHRLSTIENADEILVIDHGEIRERGNHRALLEQNGAYKQLYSMQFSG
ncbi:MULTISPECIES: lipid A ABC transporter ATP-binding protein/permease MsbA [Haemophilus]|uniref:Fused lipid transporter subunits of ABC superfamily: membrane component/ATP-binding component n=1 Tax=Haemophilus aegyptius TaxID=197575 RepID=A0ABY1VZB2_HAEAE|nr:MULTISPECIES: lipid A ABC transporter ATP-binding protein/permease MsbA [Haemophilus]EGF17092.1 ABC superfamily ATP binding cassette transporter, ABC/membrane protein [Haemophilus aegyptius ATCC 11116]OBX81441.1 lipid ABC transporter permease/ATP-binding protein [Haemophilus aegyptius]TMQ44421.1 lipid A export permease/ATP-binding protein MsbA [Haemophilus influenzae biotype aegyptius]UAK82351.1 lipid A ABC transporter ATP-binding protein/permease MsbA [Haemophilus aegyptius]SQH38267.1 fuse